MSRCRCAAGAAMGMRRMASRFCRNGARQAHHHRKMPIAAALVQIAGALAADRRLNHGIHVARREAIARGAHAVHVDANGRLAQRAQHREIRDARHLGQHRGDAIGRLLQGLQVVAVDLDGVLALDPGCGLLDVVLDVLREIEIHARETAAPARPVMSWVSFSLSTPGRPGLEGLQRHEEFGVEETGGIGAVVGPAVLRDHRSAPPGYLRISTRMRLT